VKCRGGFKGVRTGGKAGPRLVQPGARPADERKIKIKMFQLECIDFIFFNL
jgi:hypothetical protein